MSPTYYRHSLRLSNTRQRGLEKRLPIDKRYSQYSELLQEADDFLNIRKLAYFIYLEEDNLASLIYNYVRPF